MPLSSFKSSQHRFGRSAERGALANAEELEKAWFSSNLRKKNLKRWRDPSKPRKWKKIISGEVFHQEFTKVLVEPLGRDDTCCEAKTDRHFSRSSVLSRTNF